jgi:TP901 family phage tail tape measure protein
VADRSVVVKLKADVQGFRSSMASAKRSVDDLTKADVNKPAKSFDSLATKAAFAGGAIALGIGKAISSFAEFDATMSAAAAATGSTGTELQALRDAAVKAGADTQFSATEAAQGITEMAKAGVSAKDILGGGLTGALNLAAAGQLSVGDASEIAATALNQFNLQGKDVSHVADLYSAAAGKAQGSVQDIAGAMKYAGVTAASMGVSIEETTGTLGLFASKGIIGESAGTSFRSMLMSLTAPSKAAAATMEDLGINVYDANGKFVGMQGAAEVLKKKLGPLDEATRNQALGQIFGNESMGAAITLYQAGGKGVADWTKKVNDAGFAQEQAAKLTDNLQGDIERLGGSIETTFIQTGSGANGALRTLTQTLGNAVNTIGSIPAPLLLAGSALGSIALLAPKAISSFKNYSKQLDDIGLSMDKIAAKSPKLAGAIRGVQGAFAGLAIAATVGAIAGAFTQLEDLNIDPQKLEDAANGLDLINQRMAETSDLGLPVATTLSSFGDVLEATFSPGTAQNIDSFFAKLNSAVTGGLIENNSDVAIAAQRFQELDQTLATMAGSGHGDAAARVFDEMAHAAQAQGISVEDLNAKLPAYAAALSNVGTTATTTGGQMDAMSQDVKDVQQSADDAQKALDDLEKTIEGFGSPAAEARGASRDFQAAIDDASSSVRDQRDELIKNRLAMLGIEEPTRRQTQNAGRWADKQILAGKGLDITTAAGRKNQQALDNIRDATLKNVTATFKLTGSAGKATTAMKNGRDAFIHAATAAGQSRKSAEKLADQLGLIPKDVKTQIALSGVPQAKAKAAGVQGQMDKLGRTNAKPKVSPYVNGAAAASAEARLDTLARNRTATITVTTHNFTTGAGLSGANRKVNSAAGGYITGPGSATSDSIPAMLSNKEFVIRAAAVEKYGVGFMQEVNAMRLAGGGLASRAVAPSLPGSGAGIDYTRLAREFARAIPPNISVYSGADAASAARTALRRWEWDQVSRL